MKPLTERQRERFAAMRRAAWATGRVAFHPLPRLNGEKRCSYDVCVGKRYQERRIGSIRDAGYSRPLWTLTMDSSESSQENVHISTHGNLAEAKKQAIKITNAAYWRLRNHEEESHGRLPQDSVL